MIPFIDETNEGDNITISYNHSGNAFIQFVNIWYIDMGVFVVVDNNADFCDSFTNTICWPKKSVKS